MICVLRSWTFSRSMTAYSQFRSSNSVVGRRGAPLSTPPVTSASSVRGRLPVVVPVIGSGTVGCAGAAFARAAGSAGGRVGRGAGWRIDPRNAGHCGAGAGANRGRAARQPDAAAAGRGGPGRCRRLRQRLLVDLHEDVRRR